ncbi:hypothetical protein MTO96_015828 [Rhipicephalus appendiculatus]
MVATGARGRACGATFRLPRGQPLLGGQRDPRVSVDSPISAFTRRGKQSRRGGGGAFRGEEGGALIMEEGNSLASPLNASGQDRAPSSDDGGAG